MRIVCQKCSAAYAIDDKHVTAKGVRAQCPRCKNLQLVKREESAEPPTSPAAAAPMAFEFGPPPPGPQGAASPAPFDFNPTPMPNDGHAAFDFGAPPPAGAQGLALGFGVDENTSGAPFEFGAPPADPQSSAASSFDFPPAPSGSPVLPRCSSCGTELSDPFDQALGTCDDCRSKTSEPPRSSAPKNARPVTAGQVERIDTSALAARIQAAEEAPPPKVKLVAVGDEDEEPTRIELPRSAYREGVEPRDHRKTGVIAISVVVVLALVGGVLAYTKPWKKKAPPVVVKTAPATSKAVAAIVQGWKATYPELEGATSKEGTGFVSQGEAALAKDTTQSYREAEVAFQKALVIDSSNDRAAAGWALALAFGRSGRLDEATLKAAETLLSAAEQRSGQARVYVAHALLESSVGGNTNDINARAERGLQSGDAADQALAEVALGEAQLSKNPTLAERHFNEALRLDPKLKRAYLFRARLAETLGRYKEAAEGLEKRLELDADQLEVAEELMRLYVEVGETAKARKVIERARAAAPKSAQAKVLHAMLSFQHLQDLDGAGELLRSVVADAEADKADVAQAQVQLAALLRVQGELDGAKATAEAALELRPDSVPARVQLVMALIEKGVPSQARLELETIKGRLPGKLETVLEGMLMLSESRFDEAVTALVEVADADASRVDALLLAGAAAVKAKKPARAWELCLKRGLQSDPWVMPVPAMAQLYVRPADVLKPAVGAYSELGKGHNDDPNPELCEGLIAYYAELYARSQDRLAKVNVIDGNNVEALAYRALIALKRGDVGGALKYGAKPSGSKLHPLAQLAAGAGFLAANKLEPAKRALDQANKYAPKMLGPRVLLGDIEARLKSPDEARKYLSRALLSDPLYREAKRVLYKHGL